MSLPFESRWVCGCFDPQNVVEVMPCDSEAQSEGAMQCSPSSLGVLTLREASHLVKKSTHAGDCRAGEAAVGTLADRVEPSDGSTSSLCRH